MIDYVPPALPFDPAEELADKTAVAQASNDWLRCARDHGYPELDDAEAPKVDGYRSMPSALLPVTIAPPQLELLLDECPLEDYWAGAWPSLGLDVDGYDGRVPLREAPILDGQTQALVEPLVELLAAAIPTGPPAEENGKPKTD
ncbi:MAG: hypothetical protein LBJ62_07450 [Bifidobacteriaceae bacterium]|nr:hypothetical protein [Bifidobacteriaceae bacterium]